MPPLKKRKNIALLMSVCMSVTFSFPINNSRMPWPTFLKHCPNIRPGQQMNPIDFEVTGSKVKVIGVKCVKTVSDCLSNNFQKWISPSYICATYFELTYPVLQDICDKKNFRGHNVWQIFLVLLLFVWTLYSCVNHIVNKLIATSSW